MLISKSARARGKGLKNHQRVRVHMGAAERLGKIVILGASEKIEPKQSVFCQITIAEPLLALRGDHFILRDETARRTLARRSHHQPLGATPQTRRNATAGSTECALEGRHSGAH